MLSDDDFQKTVTFCTQPAKGLFSCLNQNSDELNKCVPYLKLLNECQKKLSTTHSMSQELMLRLLDPDHQPKERTFIGNSATSVIPRIFDPETVENPEQSVNVDLRDSLKKENPRIFDESFEVKRSAFGDFLAYLIPQVFEKKDDDDDDNDDKKEEKEKKEEKK